MKKILFLAALFAALAYSVPSIAQVSDNRHAITYRFLASDHLAPLNNQIFTPSQWKYGAEIGYYHYISQWVNLGVPVRMSLIDYPVDKRANGRFNRDVLRVGADVVGILKSNNGVVFKEHSWFAPYLMFGIGTSYTDKVNEKWDIELPLGLGINWRLGNNISLQTQAEYRYSFILDRPSYVYSAGFVFDFGGGMKDADGDGIADDEDVCPTVFGKKEFQGCPDTDGDGIADKEDACPKEKGTVAMKGCPDGDNDGVQDKDDKCPTVFGTVANKGCPEIKPEDKKILTEAAAAVEFETGSAKLTKASYANLDKLVDIMARYTDYKCSIQGHTDNVGKADKNQKLSEDRAKACFEYVISKGVNPTRLSYTGYGQTVPKMDNSTKEGRKANRRTEFVMTLK